MTAPLLQLGAETPHSDDAVQQQPTPPRGRWRRRRGDLARLVARRTAIAIPILVTLSAAVFLLAARSPFNPLAAFLGSRYQQASEAQKAMMGEQLGFDVTWWRAWWLWAGDAIRGDLGWSRVYSAPVVEVIGERLPWTLLLSGSALLLAITLAIVLGTVAGLTPGSRVDRLCSGVAVVLQAMPPFVLGLAAVALFAMALQWAPVAGASAPGQPYTVGGVATHLVLPTVTLALTQLPWLLLAVRTAVTRAIGSDAVRGARLRGVGPVQVVTGHVLPVSMASLVTLVGARLPELVAGAVLVEEIFGWPGLAAAVVESARAMDFPLLATLTLATTFAVLLGSLLADAAYLLLDPRVGPDV